MLLLGKIMILQGVGHPISCLGVCYANDPKKGGYMTPVPALDLTTSLRGDSIAFGSAPRREVDSQPFSPCARPPVSHTETHSLGFLSVADASASSGATLHCSPSSGRMVMQPTAVFWSAVRTLVRCIWRRRRRRRRQKSADQDSNHRPKNFASATLPFDEQLSERSASPLLGAF